MLLLVPLALLVVVGAVVALSAALRGRRTARQPRAGAGVGLLGIVVGAVLVLVAAAAVVGGGLGSSGDGDRRSADPAAGAARSGARAATSSSGAREATRRELEAGTREVVVTAPADDEFTPPAVVDQIDGRVVLRVRAVGFEPSVSGWVEQCTATPGGTNRCGNRFPVQFGDTGRAHFQYLVGDQYRGAGAPSCGADGVECIVRLTDGATTAVVNTVFGESVRRSRMTVTPRPTALASGARVEVSLSGFAEGSVARVAVCAAPATSGTRRCGVPGPVRRVPIDGDGTASTRVALREQKVGSDGVLCGRDIPCAIVVTSVAGVGVVAPVEVTFASGPGASYDAARLMLGLAVAAILLGIGVALVRRTDWRKPSEAETPVMDAAPLVDV